MGRISRAPGSKHNNLSATESLVSLRAIYRKDLSGMTPVVLGHEGDKYHVPVVAPAPRSGSMFIYLQFHLMLN